MASEDHNHKEYMTSMEEEVVKLKALMAQEVAVAQAKSAANEELLAALQQKVLILTKTPLHAAAVQQLQQESNFEAAVKTHFQPSWLEQHGLGGMTQESVGAMCTQFLHLLHETRGGAVAVDEAAGTASGCEEGPLPWARP